MGKVIENLKYFDKRAYPNNQQTYEKLNSKM